MHHIYSALKVVKLLEKEEKNLPQMKPNNGKDKRLLRKDVTPQSSLNSAVQEVFTQCAFCDQEKNRVV